MGDFRNNPTKIIVHHDGVSRKGPSIDVVNEFHKTRDFPLSSLGFYVGYHYWIERDGSQIQTRKLNEVGAHCLNHNLASIGIGLAGNFDVELPTDAQVATLSKLLSALMRSYGFAATAIQPHRMYATKTCYGSLLSNDWAQILYLEYELHRLSELLAKLRARSS